MPIVSAPLLEYQISYLKSAGITEVCFATNYMAEAVAKTFGSGAALGVDLVYAVEDEPLDTGGAIRNAYEAFPGESCVVFNGDVIHGFDISDIIRMHEGRNADITLTLRSVNRPHAYGVVPLGPDSRVLGFHEPSDEHKRTLSATADPGVDTINAGLYVMSAAAIETIPLQRCNIEREVFPALVADNWRVFGDVRGDFWIDIGRPSQYLEAVRAVVAGLVRSPHPLLKVADSAVDASANVALSASLSGCSAVGPKCEVADNASIKSSAIFEGVAIGSGASVENSIIAEGSFIGENATVRNAVLAANSHIGPNSCIGPRRCETVR
jgi:mannose-1-phosphate guanylyltransferase